MKIPDRLSIESCLLDVLTDRATRHEAATWARKALASHSRIEDPISEEVLEGLTAAADPTGNPSRPYRITDDALRAWAHRLKTEGL